MNYKKERDSKKAGTTHTLPIPGQRIVRSVIAAVLCVVIYFVRGRNGALFYSVIAALQCIQPYTANMLKVGRNRIIGTLVGAFWGAVVLFGALWISGGEIAYEHTLIYYLILALFIGIVLYSTVILKVTQSAYFSGVVFLSITLNHIGDANPYLFVFNRTLDTIIGVGVAVLANSIHFPRNRDRETLFVSGVDHVLFREDRNLSPYTRVQLNRFIQDGMRFSVSTKQTPATVRELTEGIGLRLPIIAMDGAVIYDMNSQTYLHTVTMERKLAGDITEFFLEERMPFLVSKVEENLLVIYCRGFKLNSSEMTENSAQDAINTLYLKKKNSPYRNYVNTEEDIVDNVLYFLIMDRRENIERIHEKITKQPWADRVKAVFDTFDCREGELILRIYSGDATRRAMLEELRRYTGAPRTIFFSNDPSECDVVIPDAGGGHMVKELKKRYEPVSLAGWKNIIHF